MLEGYGRREWIDRATLPPRSLAPSKPIRPKTAPDGSSRPTVIRAPVPQFHMPFGDLPSQQSSDVAGDSNSRGHSEGRRLAIQSRFNKHVGRHVGRLFRSRELSLAHGDGVELTSRQARRNFDEDEMGRWRS